MKNKAVCKETFRIKTLRREGIGRPVNPKLITQSPSVAYNIAMNNIKQEAYGKAKKLLRKALELDPKFAKAKQLLKKLP